MSLPILQVPDLHQQARLISHKTPFFLTSKEILRVNYSVFTDLFDDAEVCYALKANSDPKVLTYLKNLGASFEAASGYEVTQLVELGVNPDLIIYGTSIKPAEHIQVAYEVGVTRFAADSREELKKIAENAPGVKVFVRSIVEDSGSVFMMSERFGTPANTVKDMLLYARELGLQPYGISFYVGSQAAHADMWSRGITTIKPIMEELQAEGVILEMINIGGGFPVHYDNHQDVPELREIVINIHNSLHALPYIPKLLMEPGRGLVASSTVLVSEVIARNDRGGKPWLCMDAGIYNALYEAMIHQGKTAYPVTTLVPTEETAEQLSYTIAGPTGDSLDIIARDVMLPASIGVGDKLIFSNAGAYTVTMASPFNGFPAPPLYID